MKLVIADDESLIRASLSSMIKDMEGSWEIVSEATNGEELLAMVAEHRPDIALVDIRMPKMSGLDAIRMGKTISPQTNWLILSGFSDFSYAQQALKMDVSEYLVKPIDPVELERTLHHIYKDNKEHIILLNQQFENSLFALCNGLTSLKYEDRNSLFHQGWFMGWTFNFDTAKPASYMSAVQCEFYEDLRRSMDRHMIYGMNLALLSLPNGELAAVGAWDPAAGVEGKRHVYAFFKELEWKIKSYRSVEITVTVLQTGECHGFEAVNRRLQHLQQWGDIRAVCGIGRCFDYAELMKEADYPEKVKGARLLCTLGVHHHEWMYMNYQNAVNELEALLRTSNLFAAEKTQLAIRHFISYAIGVTLQEKITVPQMIGELRQYGESVLHGMCAKEPPSADLVQQVIQYIEKYYMDDIGIKQIAGQVNVSANYLSALFHKKTGVLFVKYLTRIRMQKAKELLLNTNLQVRQIAEQVGYYSTRHFTKLFTQTFGGYPSDLRKNLLQAGRNEPGFSIWNAKDKADTGQIFHGHL